MEVSYFYQMLKVYKYWSKLLKIFYNYNFAKFALIIKLNLDETLELD